MNNTVLTCSQECTPSAAWQHKTNAMVSRVQLPELGKSIGQKLAFGGGLV